MDSSYRSAAAHSLRTEEERRKKLSRVITAILLCAAMCGVAAIVLVVAGGRTGFSFRSISNNGSPPAVAQIAPVVEKYLLSSGSCGGSRSLKKLYVSSVGAYVPQFGGFPVYGDYSVVCKNGNITTTFNSSGDSKTAITYLRSSLTGWEAFTPEIFRQGEEEMKRLFEAEMSKIK